MNKKGVSKVVVVVLLILISIAAVSLIGYFVIGFVNRPYEFPFGETSFVIVDMTPEDILYDRVGIRNDGETNLTSYLVQVNEEVVELIVHRKIEPLEIIYLYLADYFLAGENTVRITSNDYMQEKTFDVEEDWHVLMESFEVSGGS